MWKNLSSFVQEVADLPNHIKEVTTEDIDVETPEEYSRNTYDSQLDEVSLQLEKTKQELSHLQTKFDVETERLNTRVKELEDQNNKQQVIITQQEEEKEWTRKKYETEINALSKEKTKAALEATELRSRSAQDETLTIKIAQLEAENMDVQDTATQQRRTIEGLHKDIAELKEREGTQLIQFLMGYLNQGYNGKREMLEALAVTYNLTKEQRESIGLEESSIFDQFASFLVNS